MVIDHDSPGEPDGSAGGGEPTRAAARAADGGQRARPSGRAGARIALSVPGAIGGALLIGAIAFGANLSGATLTSDRTPAAETSGAPVGRTPGGVASILGAGGTGFEPGTEPSHPAADGTGGFEQTGPSGSPDATEPAHASEPPHATTAPSGEPDGEPGDGPGATGATGEPDGTAHPEPTRTPEPTHKPEPSRTPAPSRTPEPTKTPAPTPAPSALTISAEVGDGAVVLHWETCAGDGFSHYRVLRKTAGDAVLIAEVAGRDQTTLVDDGVEAGVTYHYLVQCKGHVGDGLILLATSPWIEIHVGE